MEIYEDTKIYIICPACTVSGGPELLHQLGAALQKRRIRSYMYYLPEHTNRPIPELYRKYDVPFTEEIEDMSQNILVVPETGTTLFYQYQDIRKALWWLSVDNWFHNVVSMMQNNISQEFRAPIQPFFYFHPYENMQIMHLTQSEYAAQLLCTNHVPAVQTASLTDYLNTVFLQKCEQIDYQEKKNIIAYNPRKGIEFTRQLIAAAPDLPWVPIQNMTPDQVQQLLARAKIYIDFGNHPGRDRIPREAAISGCCVLTNRRGAAKFFQDVPIDDQYKFADQAENIPMIITKIRQMLSNYSTEIQNFSGYRDEIRQQRQQFEQEVDAIFHKTGPDQLWLALWQNPDGDTRIWNAARTMPGINIRFLIQNEQAGNFMVSGPNKLEVITSSEAVSQYKTGQIDKILLVADLPEQPRQWLIQQGVSLEDILILDFS